MAAFSNLTVWLQRFQWTRGLRSASAVSIAALVSHVLGVPQGAAAIGTFNPLLVDNGGPYRTRLTNMLTVMIGGYIAFMVGAILPPNLAVIILATAVIAFALTFGRVLSQPLAACSVLILILYFAGLDGTLHTLHQAAIATTFLLTGGVWSVAISLLFWPLDPFRPARRSVAECYRWMGQFTESLAQVKDAEVDEVDPGFDWRHKQRLRIEAARAAISATGARAPSRTLRARNLTVLLETTDMLLARTMRLSELKATATRLQLHRASGLAREMTHWLAGAEHAIAVALDHRPPDGAVSFAREGSSRLQFITRRQQLLSTRPSSGEDLFLLLLREERDALLELEIAFDAVYALWTGNEPPSSHFASTLHRDEAPRWLDTLHANWTMRSNGFRHALRTTVVTVVDVIVMRLIHINHGFWLPMTSIILLQPFSAGTVRKSVQRVTGTVAGGILAAILAVWMSNPYVTMVIIAVFALLAVASFAVDHAIFCLFLTPIFVLLSLPHPGDWSFAVIRMATTVAGAVIAILAMRLLWPERAEEELGGLLRHGAAAAAAYLQAMLDFWSFPPEARPAAERELLAPARRACGLASNDAEEAIDRVMQEPTFGRHADAENVLRTESLTFVTYLRRLTQSVTTLALVGVDTPAARDRLKPIAARLERLAAGGDVEACSFADDLPGQSHIDVAEEQMQRLERQTTVLERAGARLWGQQTAPVSHDSAFYRRFRLHSSKSTMPEMVSEAESPSQSPRAPSFMGKQR
jgi:uncharacterized membrane protein YccC